MSLSISTDKKRILYAIIASVALFVLGEIVRPGFASVKGVESVLVISSFVGLVAAGQCFVVLIGGIDLSIPWVLNAAAILLTITSMGQNANLPEAFVITLGMGLLVGALNGAGISLFGIPAVVMTLAMNGIIEGLTLGLSNGLSCAACSSYAPALIQSLAHGFTLGIANALWLWVVVIVVASSVLAFTGFGRRIYALGTNPRAAYLTGINAHKMTIMLYALSGGFAALAGIMLVGFGGQPSLGMGDPYLFTSIAAVVVGGVNILGGRGTYLGAAIGAVSLTVLVSVLLAFQVPDYFRNISYGVVILGLLLAYGREKNV